MIEIFNQILQSIKKHSSICIYRHEKADGDAAGSQFAFKTWIEDNFPNKKVYALGSDTFEKYDFFDIVKDSITTKSLSIVLDTANNSRIDDQRYKNGLEIIKIDHHPFNDEYGNINLVVPTSAATCELLTEIFKFWEESYQLIFSLKTAEFLYSGLLTDTMSFKTTSVTTKTLNIAAYLVSKGITPNEISSKMFSKTLKQFNIANYVRNNVIYHQSGLAYIVFNQKDIEKLNCDAATIRNQVSELAGVEEFKIWTIITQAENAYKATIRSKGLVINTIAEKYAGGGHKNAAGCSPKNIDEVNSLIKDLINTIEK